MPTTRDLFTPIDELRITEPSYFAVHSVPSNAAATSFSQKTPVMALDEGSRRVYGVAPEYQLISEDPNYGFGYACRLMGSCVKGYAKTKKAAKHLAARAMLHEQKLMTYGFRDGLMIGDVRTEVAGEDTSPGCQNENYSGKLLQLCQRKKFDLPQYSYKEEGPPNDRTFITTCKVVGQEVEGVAKTKKSSKNIASKQMLAILEKGIADMNEEPDLDRVTDDDGNTSAASPPVVDAPVVDDAIAMVSEILSDSKRFESPTQEYRILDNKCAFGLIQCLLKITFSKPGEQQPRTPYVFPGSDSTEEGAKQQAARGAVLFLSL
ncbi:hypothetical protein TELCIR_15217, partial [Teladorsagia circumcincta]